MLLLKEKAGAASSISLYNQVKASQDRAILNYHATNTKALEVKLAFSIALMV